MLVRLLNLGVCLGQSHLSAQISSLSDVALWLFHLAILDGGVELQLQKLIVENARVERRDRGVFDIFWRNLGQEFLLRNVLEDAGLVRAGDGLLAGDGGKITVQSLVQQVVDEVKGPG